MLRTTTSRFMRPARCGQRGAAVIEFALSLVILVPLILGLVDYGYYFYVATNVVAAQNAGAIAAAQTTVTNCAGTLTAATNNAKTAISSYMNNAGLPSTIVTLSGTTPSCGTDPVNPTWQLTVVADFKPAIGWVAHWMKASPTAGYARFTAHTLYMAGK